MKVDVVRKETKTKVLSFMSVVMGTLVVETCRDYKEVRMMCSCAKQK